MVLHLITEKDAYNMEGIIAEEKFLRGLRRA